MIGWKNTAYRRTQRKWPALHSCDVCGGTRTLQRHHADGDPRNNSEKNVEILCQRCHTDTHMANGTWGRGRSLKNKTCVICRQVFRPRKDRDRRCGKAECEREMGRRSAQKRWHPELQEASRTACNA